MGLPAREGAQRPEDTLTWSPGLLSPAPPARALGNNLGEAGTASNSGDNSYHLSSVNSVRQTGAERLTGATL